MTEITAPLHCPDCKTSIEAFTEPKSEIMTHWCVNEHCPGRLQDMLTFVADRHVLEIEGLGPELAAALVAKGYVTDLADLYEFQMEAAQGLSKLSEPAFSQVMVMTHGLPGAAMIQMTRSMETTKTAGWDRWIAALGIPMIGIRMGKLLAERLCLQSDGMAGFPQSLLALSALPIEGIGVHKREVLLTFAKSDAAIRLCQRLHNCGVRPRSLAVAKVEGTPLAGMSFVITGEFPEIGTREYLTSKLVSLGAISKSGVTKKVTHLIVGEEAGRSKLTKAIELGIPQLDGVWLAEKFSEYGIKQVGGRFEAEDA